MKWNQIQILFEDPLCMTAITIHIYSIDRFPSIFSSNPSALFAELRIGGKIQIKTADETRPTDDVQPFN